MDELEMVWRWRLAEWKFDLIVMGVVWGVFLSVGLAAWVARSVRQWWRRREAGKAAREER